MVRDAGYYSQRYIADTPPHDYSRQFGLFEDPSDRANIDAVTGGAKKKPRASCARLDGRDMLVLVTAGLTTLVNN